MPKAASYAIVCVLSFLVGGFVFQIVGNETAGAKKLNNIESPKIAGGEKSPVPRTFSIEGMTCQGCVDTLTSGLGGIPGVYSVKISLEDKKAIVNADESQVPTEKILTAITAAGYKGQLASVEQRRPTTITASGKQPLLINITRGKNELHAVSMAIGLAQSAIKDGRTASVFLNVEAPVFARKDLGDEVKFADFPPINKMLADFIAAGGRVLVCGHCAHIVKLEQRDMINDAKVLAHNELFSTMPPGTVVFSY
jgi:copper chaperone CopZ/predicted peroxiredoxin